jgi:hypothetical protein
VFFINSASLFQRAWCSQTYRLLHVLLCTKSTSVRNQPLGMCGLSALSMAKRHLPIESTSGYSVKPRLVFNLVGRKAQMYRNNSVENLGITSRSFGLANPVLVFSSWASLWFAGSIKSGFLNPQAAQLQRYVQKDNLDKR